MLRRERFTYHAVIDELRQRSAAPRRAALYFGDPHVLPFEDIEQIGCQRAWVTEIRPRAAHGVDIQLRSLCDQPPAHLRFVFQTLRGRDERTHESHDALTQSRIIEVRLLRAEI